MANREPATPPKKRARSATTTNDLPGFLAALAGLVGYVYLLGGLALYIELFRTGVPAGEALEAFNGRRFILIGAPILAAFVCLSCVVWFVLSLWGSGNNPGDASGRARRLTCAVRRHRARAVMATALVFFVIGMGFAVVNGPSMELRRAKVKLQDGRCVKGAYLSADASGVHLADGVKDRLLTVPEAQVVSLRIGEKSRLVSQAITGPGPCSD